MFKLLDKIFCFIFRLETQEEYRKRLNAYTKAITDEIDKQNEVLKSIQYKLETFHPVNMIKDVEDEIFKMEGE